MVRSELKVKNHNIKLNTALAFKVLKRKQWVNEWLKDIPNPIPWAGNGHDCGVFDLSRATHPHTHT